MKFSHNGRIVWKTYLIKLNYVFVVLIVPVLCFVSVYGYILQICAFI
jgi:hypothetical protein